MTDSNDKQQSGIKDLIAKGREQGYLTYAEVNDHLPEDIADPEQVEDIIQMINDMGITVFETAPDAETLLMMSGDNTPDEVAAAAATSSGVLSPDIMSNVSASGAVSNTVIPMSLII